MDKLASHLLAKAPSSVAIFDSFHLDNDDSDFDSDDEDWRPPPLVKPVEVKYETLKRDKVQQVYRETLGRLSLAWSKDISDDVILESQRSQTSAVPDSQRSKTSHVESSRRGKTAPGESARSTTSVAPTYPESYRKNTNKEKLLVWYCENFRRQYTMCFPERRPLVLALENECGVQKMVCTSISPSPIPLIEFKSWSGCASYVSDHIVYEPLDQPTSLPVRLRSPSTVFDSQAGHCFELSTLLVSLLLGANIDAYVVSGYATREVCLNDQCRVVCPLIPQTKSDDILIPDEANQGLKRNKYIPKPVPDYKSRFEQMMDQRRADKEEAKRKREEEVELARLAEEEKLSPDEWLGFRLHSWVLVRTKEEEFFVEPITGRRCKVNDEQYLGIESVWNHENYWVNLQSTNTRPALDFTLTNRTLWLPLLIPGVRKRSKETKTPKDIPERNSRLHNEKLRILTEIMQEKCLDIPVSWAQEVSVSLDKYIRGRYKHHKKQIQYKRAISEQYSDYKHPNGLIERVIQYVDLECELPSRKYEKFKHRVDRLYQCDTNYETEIVQEYFQPGRSDGLSYHRHLLGEASELRSSRILHFHLTSRLDRFSIAQLDKDHFTLRFDSRNDKLIEIYVEYAQPRKKPRALSEPFFGQPVQASQPDALGTRKSLAGGESPQSTHHTLDSPKAMGSPRGLTLRHHLGSPKPSFDSPRTSLISPKVPLKSPNVLGSPKPSFDSPKKSSLASPKASLKGSPKVPLLGSPKPSFDSPKSSKPPQGIDSPKTPTPTLRRSPTPREGLSKQVSQLDSGRKSSSFTESPRVSKSPAAALSPKPRGEGSNPADPLNGAGSSRKSVSVTMATGEGGNGASKMEGEDSILIGRDDIRSFYVKFDRSENKCHDEDVSQVIFNLQHGEVSVYYHYGELFLRKV
uniref:Dynein regulatory complex subunit 7 n=1 Tax=Cacopsylla melanoneura TaxID=428564 RepID=A0A8D8Y671_9HEMI